MSEEAREIEYLTVSRDAVISLLVALAGAVAFGLIAFESIAVTRGDGRIAAVWLPNALAVAFLLRARLPREDIFLCAIWCGNLMANVAAGDSLTKASGFATANLVEILVAVLLVRRACGPKPDMTEIGHLTKFMLFAGLLAPLASAVPASITFALEGGFSILAFGKWVLGDGLGMVLIAPAVLIIADACANPRRLTARELAEWAGLTVTATALTIVVFTQTAFPLLFMVAPVVLAHAFRLGSLGTAISIINVAVIAVLMTSSNAGLIAEIDASISVKLLLLQSFLASAFLMGLPVAAILNTRKRMTQEMIERDHRFKLLAENVTDAIMCYDAEGRCNYVSPSGEDVLGVTASEFINKRPDERAHPQSIDEIAAVQARLVSGESVKERLIYRRYLDDEDGQPVYIEADCASTFSVKTGERNGIIVSARNVTERVELEHQLVRARSHAENAAKAKSQFLANMSHEIRTPMNGVLGFADLLLDSDLPREQRRHAELIAESGQTMMMLLNDILDISKIEAGQIEMREEPVDLQHMLSSCVQLHAANAAEKGIVLRHRAAQDLPLHILSDPLRLRQVLLNLIGNAVKFTLEGSVTISAGVDSGADGDMLIISVDDTGVGIEQDRLAEIFNPFEQADGAISRSFGGTGLGLTISRQLTELMGGKLSVESRPDQGSRFTLRLPLKIAEVDTAREDPGRPFAPQELPRASRILLAEDHDINRMLMTAMLERCGQQVIIARDGMEAIDMVALAERDGEQFDLVLMDIQMPRCDGYTATQTIRSAGVTAEQLPILALTANAFAEDIAAALAAGMQAHLAKPIVFEDLIAALGQWLPVRIIDETRGPLDLAADGGGIAPEPSGGHSKQLTAKWQERREEVLDAVSKALDSGALDGDDADDLARIVHKLAGTAGMFGEDELGEKARNFERALRSGVDDHIRRTLAEELLEVSGSSPD